MAAKCSHEDSRLTCIECNTPICHQCLVQCPVGFRCKSCVGSAKSPLTSASPMLVAKTLAICALIGCGAGWAMMMINMPFIGCFICYFMGLISGRFLAAKVLDHRLGSNITKIIVFGILIGMSFTPLAGLPIMMVEILKICVMAPGTPIFTGMTAIISSLFSPVLFVVGVLRPTVWGDRW